MRMRRARVMISFMSEEMQDDRLVFVLWPDSQIRPVDILLGADVHAHGRLVDDK